MNDFAKTTPFMQWKTTLQNRYCGILIELAWVSFFCTQFPAYSGLSSRHRWIICRNLSWFHLNCVRRIERMLKNHHWMFEIFKWSLFNLMLHLKIVFIINLFFSRVSVHRVKSMLFAKQFFFVLFCTVMSLRFIYLPIDCYFTLTLFWRRKKICNLIVSIRREKSKNFKWREATNREMGKIMNGQSDGK